MANKSIIKKTTVKQHPRKVPVSEKNPDGVTIVDQHERRVPGTFLDEKEISNIFNGYNREEIVYPSADKLIKYKNADSYDELIAIWVDYFNKKFGLNPPLDPNVLKALIGSESSFDANPKNNPVAIGVAQITKETLKIIQDSKGEARDFIFYEISQKDLKNPEIAIPIAARWLAYKQARARSKLGRTPSHEEIILEYKGLLKSKSKWRENALKKYRELYEKLTEK